MVAYSLFETRSDRKKSKSASTGVRRRRAKAAVEVDYSRLQQLGCKGCPLLSDDLQHPKMKPTGSKKPTIYIVGEAPGADEDNEGVQFIGSSGKYLREAMQEALDGEKVNTRWNNCCRCRPPNNRTPIREEWERCRTSVEADIEKTKPDIVVGVGGVALEWAIGEPSITKWCGRLTPIKIGKHACWFYPIMHPSYVKRTDPDKGVVIAFQQDLRKLGDLLLVEDTRLGPPTLVLPADLQVGVKYATDVKNLKRLERRLLSWSQEKAAVAFDIETTGLRPFDVLDDTKKGLLSIAFSDGKETWTLPVNCKGTPWTPDQLNLVFKLIYDFLRSSCIKVAHNLPFELEWLTLIFGHNPPWRRKGWGDTMTQAYVLDERKNSLALDFLCLQRFGFRLKQVSDVDRSQLMALSMERLLSYNALDAKYTARLYGVQKADIKQQGLFGIYREHIRRIFTLVKAQQVGLLVDFDCVDRFDTDLGGNIESCLQKISKTEEAALYKKKTGKELSPTSPAQLKVLFCDLLGRQEGKSTKNKSGYSVDEEALSRIDLPIARYILDLRNKSKLRSTYCDGFRRAGKSVHLDGRIHTKFNDLFTVTGRLSSDSPNLQNFPKRKDAWIRAIVVPPKGHVILSADYGQLEYRIIGVAANDAYVKKTLLNRYDVHLDWAERVAKADSKVYRRHEKDIKKLRSAVKNQLVFPAFYGAHSDYIARMLGMNIQACRDLFDEFWDEFAGVRRWQKKSLAAFKRDGYISCLTGRRRRAPMTKNEALNTSIQGTASDVVVDGMNRLSVLAEKADEPALQPVINIHDDLTFYLPRRRQDELCEIITEEMLSSSYKWLDVPLSVEVTIGKNWADMNKVGTFFSDDGCYET